MKKIQKRSERKIFEKRMICILILSMLMVTNFSLVFAQDSADKKTIDYYTDEKNLQEFQSLSKEKRNELWDMGKDDFSLTYKKNYIAEKLAKKITEEQFQRDLNTGRLKLAADSWVPAYFQNKGIIPEIGGVKIDAQSYDELKSIVKKNYGEDLDIHLRSVIEEMKGFGSKDLQWNDGNVIGNGKVWLNMDKLPRGINKLAYDESKGVFVLKFKAGGQIVLGEGSTNEDGSLKFFASLPDRGMDAILDLANKYKTAIKEGKELKDVMSPEELKKMAGFNMKEIMMRDLVGEIEGNPYGLENFGILNGKGEIVINKDGFEIKGDGTKVKYGDFYFGRKEGEASADSVVKFMEDRLVLRGMEFTRDGYVRVGSTKNDFNVHFGNLDSLTRGISFEDHIIEKEYKGAGPLGIGGMEDVDKTLGRTYFQFDENGKLTRIGKDNTDWIPLTMGIGSDSALKDIYDKSGVTVKEIIEKASRGKEVSLDYVKERFYSDNLLIKNGKDIKIDSYLDNFVNMEGENLVVGGHGSAEILRDFNSLNWVDAKTGDNNHGFQIKNGDMKIEFKEDGIHYKTAGVKDFFDVDSIYELDKGDPNQEYTISHNNPEGKIISKSETFTAGRETFLGPYGTSVDISIKVDKDYLGKIKEAVEGAEGRIDSSREMLTQSLMESEFKISADIFVPVNGVSVKLDKEEYMKVLDQTLFRRLKQWTVAPEGSPIAGAEVKISDETFDTLRNIVWNSIPDGKSSSVGKITLDMENHPNKNPILVLYNDGEVLSKVELSGYKDSNLVLTTMESIIRLPELEKGGVPFVFSGGDYLVTFVKHPVKSIGYAAEFSHLMDSGASTQSMKSSGFNLQSFYATRPYLQRLLYQNIWKGRNKDNVASLHDATFYVNAQRANIEIKKKK